MTQSSYCCHWTAFGCPCGAFKCSPDFLSFFLTCLCSCLLGPPASQGAPLLECRCCHCHTCTTHRPSFLPLHSVSPGVQVLLFPFLYSTLYHHTSAYTPLPPPLSFSPRPGAAVHFCLFVLWVFSISTMNVLLIPFALPSFHLHLTSRQFEDEGSSSLGERGFS